ncbi:adenylate cyclase [Fervidicella metallireducens AeB]|uniref:Adenylate cyclase n=1 Tax=Fervidicella metallireducens AeB TaxID=1403537 RepID=A0A017RXF0_9CLOT|nr:class IV adenylate cyclase [Fervidicella metallireducens]EYE89044.1 adenylate cyclase [Fervidicella metallireducens AeB]
MNEIEVKVLDVDIETIKKKIVELKGVLIKKEYQENYIYSLPMHLNNRNGYIRIRRTHDLLKDTYENILCIKKIISQDDFRITEENEVTVSSIEDCKNFLEALEVKFFRKQNKYRESYLLSDSLIEIDEWDKDIFPDPYIEIEAKTPEILESILAALSIPKEKTTSLTLEEIKKNLKGQVSD